MTSKQKQPTDVKEQPLDALLDKDSVMGGFIEHLLVLRACLIRALIGWGLVLVLINIYPGAAYLYDVLAEPLLSLMPYGQRMIATGIVSPLMVPLKLSLLVSFVMALPWIVYQLWTFVAPALYRHEKHLALGFVITTCMLFLLGMLFCYFVVFQTVFSFIQTVAPQSVAITPDINEYLGFVLMLFFAFGFVFEVPVIVVLLVKLGIYQIDQLKKFRPYLVVSSFVVGAILTPPDVVSQFLLAIPLVLLYEVGLLAARVLNKYHKKTPSK
ncbi:MAG: twin-arginine translocase subunit TatC [Alcaligenaceae bacterium]|nr:twin-arginine translocase subunit TatC [Alcaligenaceae bacterium]